MGEGKKILKVTARKYSPNPKYNVQSTAWYSLQPIYWKGFANIQLNVVLPYCNSTKWHNLVHKIHTLKNSNLRNLFKIFHL